MKGPSPDEKYAHVGISANRLFEKFQKKVTYPIKAMQK